MEKGKLLKNQEEGPETVKGGGKSTEPKRKEGRDLLQNYFTNMKRVGEENVMLETTQRLETQAII